METAWYRAWRGDYKLGDHKFLPRSDGQGKLLASTVLAPLNAQIAVFFGNPEAGLSTLQQGVSKLTKGEPVICQECGRDIWNSGHRADCDLIRQYKKVMAGPAQTPDPEERTMSGQYASPCSSDTDKPHSEAGENPSI